VSGTRLAVGAIVMGVIVPVMLYFLLGLSHLPQLLTIAAALFLSWGLADLLAVILERPRLKGRTPTQAIKDDWDRRAGE
jgi:hypothetical protein